MRYTAFLILAASIVLLTPSIGHAKRRRCPASAFKASTAVWKFGDFRTGETKTARHPCGRMITCTGGSYQPRVLRQCHWG